jgi:di/tricarboxylate transporter
MLSTLPLSPAECYLLFITGAALLLILTNRLAPDLVAILVLLFLGTSGIITPEEALSGFSSPAVITIVGLFVITATLERTGVVLWLSQHLAHLSGKTEARMVVVFMLAGALLSLFVNNIAAGGVLLPAAVRVAHQRRITPSKILIPMAFGTLVGGMATLFTTANIVLSSLLEEHGQRPLTMLDFLPSGGAMVLTGTLYMVLVGRHLLPSRESEMHTAATSSTAHSLATTYQLGERLWEAQIAPTSPLAGHTISESRIGEQLGVTVLAVLRNHATNMQPDPQTMLAANDRMLVLGREDRVRQLEPSGVVVQPATHQTRALSRHNVSAAEVIISPRSPVIGQTLQEINFRSKFGLTAIALWRSERSYRTDVGKTPLQAGDGLLMIGPLARIRVLAQEPGYVLPQEPQARPAGPRKGLWASLIAAVAIGVAAFGWIPTPEAMLAGVCALVLAGCIRMQEIYRTVEWRVVFLIAGMFPISIAMQTTGLAERLGDFFSATLTPLGPLVLIAGMYLFTVLMSQVIGGQVASLVVGPLAITAALQAGVNPVAMAVAVAMACSAAFLTPIAHAVNLLVLNPGGYTFGDFLRVGVGITLVCFLTLLVVMPLFWGV